MSNGKFVLNQASNGQWYFTLNVHENGVFVLQSETYHRRIDALGGIESIRLNATLDWRYERLVSKRGLPYFVLKAANGEVIGASREYYATADRDGVIEWTKRNASAAVVVDAMPIEISLAAFHGTGLGSRR